MSIICLYKLLAWKMKYYNIFFTDNSSKGHKGAPFSYSVLDITMILLHILE